MRRPIVIAAAALAAALPTETSAEIGMPEANHPSIGMWVTDDGRIRHELLPDTRYDEVRGTRESAYRGRYEVTNALIEYRDDTGFTADGDFVDENTPHHGGMVFRCRPASSAMAERSSTTSR